MHTLPYLSYTWLQLIDILPKPMPTDLKTIQQIFQNSVKVTSHGSVVFYKVNSVRTTDNIVIDHIDIRSAYKNPDVINFISLNLSEDQCVQADETQNKFNIHMPTDPIIPFHDDKLTQADLDNIPVYYQAKVEWGVFALSIKNKRPNCINSIVLRTF
ncbi:hypothetical protein [Commensalibacter nepenthis]|uniref:Uncharacterized protein n=1 Tax=Commensalibacter nepenthis TaxID=3043872 RepID=A0ABT6Q4B5_9PROT|nr:hypothetical protein [Commensalibacter sp. TBRC 10068]MDI2111737.1 hypothetical protein [Commensalibacter sp. TBRC 10068]